MNNIKIIDIVESVADIDEMREKIIEILLNFEYKISDLKKIFKPRNFRRIFIHNALLFA